MLARSGKDVCVVVAYAGAAALTVGLMIYKSTDNATPPPPTTPTTTPPPPPLIAPPQRPLPDYLTVWPRI